MLWMNVAGSKVWHPAFRGEKYFGDAHPISWCGVLVVGRDYQEASHVPDWGRACRRRECRKAAAEIEGVGVKV